MIPEYIQNGFVPLAYRCDNKWDEMTPVAERLRHCAACNKVIHRIDGMSREEIYNLLMTDPGNVCVAYRMLGVPSATMLRPPKASPAKRPVVRYIAVSTAVLTMLATTLAPPLAWPQVRTELAPSYSNTAFNQTGGNTLVSGVILDQNGQTIQEELELYIYCSTGEEITRLRPTHGLFSIDLKGHVAPHEEIIISIAPSNSGSSTVLLPNANLPIATTVLNPSLFAISCTESGGFPGYFTSQAAAWTGARHSCLLSNAQNLELRLNYTPAIVGSGMMEFVGIPPITNYWQDFRIPDFLLYATVILPENDGHPSHTQEPDCTTRGF